jgi:chorismate mutase-like protein
MLLLLTGTLVAQSLRWDESRALEHPREELANSIAARLLICREVAWSKFCNHAKVRDPAREARVLAELKEKGSAIGLSGEEVNLFFKPQIIASCRLQEEMIAGWASGVLPRPSAPAKDLQAEIRPLLDKMDDTLLLQWKAASSKPFDRADYYAARQQIMDQGIEPEVASIAASPLGKR